MPVGPLAVMDEVSLSLAVHIQEQTAKDLAAEGIEAPEPPGADVLEAMVREHERTGRAGGGGFYDYPEGGEKHLWKGLAAAFPEASEPLDQRTMIDRMMFVQAIETARCYEEGVLESTADANVGSILGWGFAPFKGGTLQFINDYGVPEFVARSQVLAEDFGPRFAPPELLIRMAEKGETFGL